MAQKAIQRKAHIATPKPAQPFFGKIGKHSFFKASDSHAKKVVQPKLKIGAPGDRYEQEADRIADQVVQRLPQSGDGLISRKGKSCEDELQRKPFMQTVTPTLQRTTLENSVLQRQAEEEEEMIQPKLEAPVLQRQEEEEEPVQRQVEEEEEEMVQPQLEEEEEPIQAKGGGATVAPNHFTQQLRTTKGSGQPLPSPIRGQMEHGFGADLSHVRIHTGRQASQLSQSIHAQAFTHGQDIYFNEGKFQPGSTAGQRLLAHELVHVGQQNGKRIKRKPTEGNSGGRGVCADKISIAIYFNRIFRTARSRRILKRVFGIPKNWSFWNRNTIKSICAWQKRNSLRPDGQVGPNSLKIIVNRLIKQGYSGKNDAIFLIIDSYGYQLNKINSIEYDPSIKDIKTVRKGGGTSIYFGNVVAFRKGFKALRNLLRYELQWARSSRASDRYYIRKVKIILNELKQKVNWEGINLSLGMTSTKSRRAFINKTSQNWKKDYDKYWAKAKPLLSKIYNPQIRYSLIRQFKEIPSRILSIVYPEAWKIHLGRKYGYYESEGANQLDNDHLKPKCKLISYPKNLMYPFHLNRKVFYLGCCALDATITKNKVEYIYRKYPEEKYSFNPTRWGWVLDEQIVRKRVINLIAKNMRITPTHKLLLFNVKIRTNRGIYKGDAKEFTRNILKTNLNSISIVLSKMAGCYDLTDGVYAAKSKTWRIVKVLEAFASELPGVLGAAKGGKTTKEKRYRRRMFRR
jgi:hypothetical protein